VDLDQSATKALNDVKNLITHFGEGYKAFDQLEQQIKQVAQEVHSDWPPVLEKAKHLLDDIKRQQHEMDEEAKHADQVLKDLKHKMDAVHQQAQEHLHTSTGHAHDLEQHVHGLEPDVAGVLRHAEETGHSLRDGATHIHDELHHHTSDTGHYVENDAVSHVKESETAVDEHSHEYHDHVSGNIMPEIQAKHEECHQHLDEHHQHFEEKLTTLQQQKHDQVTQHMEQCHDKHSQIFDDFTNVGHHAEEVMGHLSKAVDAGGTAVHEGMETLGAACDSLGVGLKLCIDIFEELDKIFKDFKFLGL
jgi:uncharacterized protein YoxC